MGLLTSRADEKAWAQEHAMEMFVTYKEELRTSWFIHKQLEIAMQNQRQLGMKVSVRRSHVSS